MNEADYKRKIVRQIKIEGGWGRRFEDQYAVGITDLILIPLGGPPFVAEVKIVKPTWGATDRQLLELKRIKTAGKDTVVTLLIGVNEKERTYVAARPALNVSETVCSVPIDQRHWNGKYPITTLLRQYAAATSLEFA